MLKLITRFALLLALFIGGHLLLKAIISDVWGSSTIKLRTDYYLDHADEYNALFVGSSLTKHHIDPLVISEHLDSSLDVRIYNMSDGGYYTPESTIGIDNILKNKPDNLKYIFLEMTTPSPAVGNKYTTRTTYWHNLQNSSLIIQHIQAGNFGDEYEQDWLEETVASTVMNYLHFGRGKDILTLYLFPNRTPNYEQVKGINGHGFYPLPLDLISASRQKLLDDPTIVDNIRQKATNQRKNMTFVSEPIRQHLYDLMERADAHGVELIFVMPPRFYTPVFNALPEERRIDISSPDVYPQLYTLENSWDATHLNEVGAAQYSTLFAEALNAYLLKP